MRERQSLSVDPWEGYSSECCCNGKDGALTSTEASFILAWRVKRRGLYHSRKWRRFFSEIDRGDVMRTGVVAHERIFLDRSGDIRERLKTPQAQMSWDLLFKAWRDQFPSERYHLGSGVVFLSTAQDHAEVHLSDGSVHRADLVIGADGIGSIVRAMVAPGSKRDTQATQPSEAFHPSAIPERSTERCLRPIYVL